MVRHNSYINLLVIQCTLRDRGVETGKTFIILTGGGGPQFTAKLITLIYGREGINRVDGEVR